MNNFYKLFFLILWLGISNLIYAQEGTIRGSVIEDTTGEPLYGVTVMVQGTSKGTATDFDGKFDLDLDGGTYDLRISYVSFQPVIIQGVNVTSDEITVIDNIRLQKAVEEMGEVVVTAEAVNISEAALLTKKKKSVNMLDGISAEKFAEVGVSDAADAIKRVTGVSIQNGKYVYVRGLGDRYTNTMLNSVEIPSLDPTKNSLQIDIFPTNLIENIVISKTAVAEMPADFTGGMVNIETKDFPEKPILDVSASISYNPQMHFNSNYLTYPGSNTDFLGFDGGARALPDGANQEDIPSPFNAPEQEVFNFVDRFNPTLGPVENTNYMDYSLGISLGDQYDVGSANKFGYTLSATYKNSSKHYRNFRYGEYQLSSDANQNELVRASTQNGVVSERNILLGGLAGIAFKTRNSKYKLTGMHLQNGDSKSANFFIDNSESAPGQSGYLGDSYNLEYSERSITNVLLNGVHYFDKANWQIDWRLSPTLSKMQDPDIRKTTYTLRGQGDNQDYVFDSGAGGFPGRLWRTMEEVNLVGRVNVAREYELFGKTARLKIGGSHVYKQRDYEILSYDMNFFSSTPDWDGDPSEILVDENIYGGSNDGPEIYYQSGNADPNPNAYNSNVHSLTVYVSNEFSPVPNLRVNLGIRAENYIQRHTGRDANGQNSLDNAKVLNALDFFPSANLTYLLMEEMNLRFSYSKTIARPSFRELSFAQILDPVSDRIFNGGLFPVGCDSSGNNCSWDGNLRETRIQNFDLRWEAFLSRNQLVSVSVFYKSFEDPLELVRLRTSPTTSEYQPRNVGSGRAYGAEFEIRKSLDFLSPSFTNLGFSGNVTVVESVIEMTEGEYQARKSYERESQDMDDQRQMAGQAPYVINAGLTYQNSEFGFDTGFFYNVKGETLVLVGGGVFPDVYSEPYHSLNFNFNKSFGALSANINVSNILNDTRRESYHGYKAEDQIYSAYKPYTSVSVGLKYSF